jgi:6-phosphogluconolactonase
MEYQVYPDPEALARAAVEYFISLAKAAVDERGVFSVALSGGDTPKNFYALLATPQYAEQIPWDKTHIFWGDERCVPPEHPDSNYGLAQALLLSKVPLPEKNLHRIKCESSPERAATEYEAELREFFGTNPGFDLVLLGVGEEGHTASLFPGGTALDEKHRWVLAQFFPKLPAWRITLTPIALNSAANVVFMICGEKKAGVIKQIFLEGGELLPVHLIRPRSGRLLWLLDASAASLLTILSVTKKRL